MAAAELMRLALDAIHTSCLIDFPDSLAWAQWCRNVARAGAEGDEDGVRQFFAEMELNRSRRAERAAKWLDAVAS